MSSRVHTKPTRAAPPPCNPSAQAAIRTEVVEELEYDESDNDETERELQGSSAPANDSQMVACSISDAAKLQNKTLPPQLSFEATAPTNKDATRTIPGIDGTDASSHHEVSDDDNDDDDDDEEEETEEEEDDDMDDTRNLGHANDGNDNNDDDEDDEDGEVISKKAKIMLDSVS